MYSRRELHGGSRENRQNVGKFHEFVRLGGSAGLPPPGISLKHLGMDAGRCSTSHCVAARDFAKNAPTRRRN